LDIPPEQTLLLRNSHLAQLGFVGVQQEFQTVAVRHFDLQSVHAAVHLCLLGVIGCGAKCVLEQSGNEHGCESCNYRLPMEQLE